MPIIFLVYWLVFQRNLKIQNVFLLTISYLFYCWWDWRFLLLLFACSGINYIGGMVLGSCHEQKKKKIILAGLCILSLGLLGIFKYFNFFIDNFIHAFSLIGVKLQPRTLNIILPVGISFYTFKALSYTIDIYRERLKPTKDWVAFFSFVAFFPQLLAGPIDRATNLLPQFYTKRIFRYENAVDALRQILWGCFMKIAIADNCAGYVDRVFQDHQVLPASTLILGSIVFTFQIYADFSGYSDIAIGVARLFGFDTMRNFNFPYFSRDIAEFWRRWHISLTTWFRDYLYIPLGGNRGVRLTVIRNVFIVFLVSGFWHGANWTFLAWGFIHALLFMPLLLLGRNREHLDTVARNRQLPGIKEVLQMAGTFFLVTFAWIFFRAENIGQAFSFISHMFQKNIVSIPDYSGMKLLLPLLSFMIVVEWLQRDRRHGLDLSGRNIPGFARLAVYYGLIAVTLLCGANQQIFIYSQF